MEVRLIPISGCLNVFLGVMTLGVAPLGTWIAQRSWPKRVDEEGLVTRGGKRIPWSAITKVTKVITRIQNGAATTEHYELRSPQGKVVVAVYRLENGAAVWAYIWERLPEAAKGV
jgi:hypothetical protein